MALGASSGNKSYRPQRIQLPSPKTNSSLYHLGLKKSKKRASRTKSGSRQRSNLTGLLHQATSGKRMLLEEYEAQWRIRTQKVDFSKTDFLQPFTENPEQSLFLCIYLFSPPPMENRSLLTVNLAKNVKNNSVNYLKVCMTLIQFPRLTEIFKGLVVFSMFLKCLLGNPCSDISNNCIGAFLFLLFLLDPLPPEEDQR